MEILHPLTTGQRRLYLDHMFHPEDPVQNLACLHELRGNLDRDCFIEAYRAAYDSVGIFKTNLVEREGTPFLNYDPSRPFRIEEVRRGSDENAGVFQARVLLDAHRLQSTPIGLQDWPFTRLVLYRASQDLHYLLQGCPHFFLDAYSVASLMKNVSALYNGETRTPLTNDLHLWAAGNSRGQDGQRHESQHERDLAFYQEEVKGLRSLEVASIKQPRCCRAGHQGRVVACQFSKAVLHDCPEPLRESDNILFLAVYVALLQKLLGSPLVIGYPVPNRGRADRDRVGCFVNTLPLVVDDQAGRTFSELVSALRKKTRRMYRHQDLDLGSVSHIPTGMNCYYTFYPDDLNFSLQGCVSRRLPVERGSIFSEARCTVARRPDGYDVELDLGEYFKDIEFAGLFGHLLKSLAVKSETPLASLNLAEVSEANGVYSRVNSTRHFETAGSLKAAFEVTVGQNGSRTAVCDTQGQWSYDELNERANKIARCLQDKAAGRSLVAVSAKKSRELVAILLAILKLGKCYIPVDPTSPRKRLEYILGDLENPFLVTEGEPLANHAGISLSDLLSQADGFSGENLGHPVDGAQCAYIIYTSGSTGRPKGVEVTNRNVLSLLAACDGLFDFRADDVWTMFHSYGFDFSVWEMFGCLLHGGRLMIVDDQAARDPRRFYDILVREQVTVLSQTPSAFKFLTQEDLTLRQNMSLRYIVFGGEALDFSVLNDWVQHHPLETTRIVNMYGITETTVHVTYYPVKDSDLNAKKSMIGKPLLNGGVYILGKDGTILPTGAVGEIFVFGDGVARGYYRNEKLTLERFTTINGVRGYRSGDLGKITPGGDIEYLGRMDRQVKVRGYRIEPGEVESCLRNSGLVRDCAVGAISPDPHADARLVAYVVPGDSAYNEVALREHVRANLPGFMVPSFLIPVSGLPLTVNGKVDFESLSQHLRSHTHRIKGANETQRWLFGVVCDTVKHDEFGVMDNLFDAGLTSLDLADVLARIREPYPALRISPLTLFQHPTVERMADYLDGKGRTDVQDPARVDRGEVRRRLASGRDAMGGKGAPRHAATVDEDRLVG